MPFSGVERGPGRPAHSRRVQDWYATGYREGTSLERISIFSCWLVFRLLFVATFALAQKMGG